MQKDSTNNAHFEGPHELLLSKLSNTLIDISVIYQLPVGLFIAGDDRCDKGSSALVRFVDPDASGALLEASTPTQQGCGDAERPE